MQVTRQLCLLALVLAACTLSSEAKIHHSVVDADDRRLIPLTEGFGFAADGRGQIHMTLRDVQIWVPHDEQGVKFDLDNFGFFLSPVEADGVLEAELATKDECILKKIKPSQMPTFKDSAIKNVIYKKDTEAVFNLKLDSPGLFYLYFANCDPDYPVSFDAMIEEFNLDDDGDKIYLSVGETQLEILFLAMFVLFTAVGAEWGYYVWRNKEHAHRIHILMGVLCGLKALTVMSQAGMYHFVERTGHADGWNIAYYIFNLFTGVLFFTLLVLVGTGWSYMEPFPGDRKKCTLMVVIPLQLFSNLAIIVLDENSPSWHIWFTWRDTISLVDLICYCAVLFPIRASIKHWGEASNQETHPTGAHATAKLTLFRQFFRIVLLYFIMTRISVYLLKTMTMQVECSWVGDAVDQLTTLAFYVWTAVMFRPQSDHLYLKLGQAAYTTECV